MSDLPFEIQNYVSPFFPPSGWHLQYHLSKSTVFLSVAIVLFLFNCTYLGSREAELWGAKVFHSLIDSPNARNWQGWDKPKPRARSSSWVSPVHGSRIFSVSLIRQLDWRERWDLVTDSLVWDVPRGSLMCRTTTSAPMVHSFWQLCNIPSYLIYTPQFVHSVGELGHVVMFLLLLTVMLWAFLYIISCYTCARVTLKFTMQLWHDLL